MPNININSLDGSTIESYIALPKKGIGPGLIILHEIFGVSASIKKTCDHYASLGYVVICPNLFWRDIKMDQLNKTSGELDWEQATKLYNNYDIESGLRDIFAVLAHLRQKAECSSKVGVLGFCLGSRLAYLMATRSDINCTASYYGVGIDSFLDEVHDISVPYLIHLAEQDKLMSDQVRKKMIHNLSRNKMIETHLYPVAEHGFARMGNPKYHEESALLANERTEKFLEKTLF